MQIYREVATIIQSIGFLHLSQEPWLLWFPCYSFNLTQDVDMGEMFYYVFS